MNKDISKAEGFIIAANLSDKPDSKVFLNTEGGIVVDKENAHTFDNHQAAMGFLEYISETPSVLDFVIVPAD